MRIPLVGPYNTRPSTPAASATSSGIVGVGIVGVMIVGLVILASQKDRRFVNCYVQTISDDLQRENAAYCVKRPGFAAGATLQPGSIGNAIRVWLGGGDGNGVVSAFGNTNSTIYIDQTAAGTITGLATGIQETTISAVDTLVVSSSDNTGWYYAANTAAVLKITDPQFPGNMGVTLGGTFAPFAGWVFIMGTDGRVYNSKLNCVTGWEDSNYFATNSYTDKGVACIRHRNTIVAFGTQSFEVLRNAGVPPPGSPLARIDDLTQKIGAITAGAIVNVLDVIYFAGATENGNVSIYSYDGGKAEPISTAPIDAQLLLAGPANIGLSAVSWYGVTVLIVQAANLTYAYGVGQSNPWFEMESAFPIWQKADGISVGPNIINYTISTTDDSGILYIIHPATAQYTDNGFAYTATIQTGSRDEGTNNRHCYNSLSVIGDQETGTSTLNINWTNDDYKTFNSDTRSVDLTSDYRVARMLGTARRRAWKLTHSSNTPMRLQAIDVDVVPMKS